MQDLLERDPQAHQAGPVLRAIPGDADQRHRLGMAAWAFLVVPVVAAVARSWARLTDGWQVALVLGLMVGLIALVGWVAP